MILEKSAKKDQMLPQVENFGGVDRQPRLETAQVLRPQALTTRRGKL